MSKIYGYDTNIYETTIGNIKNDEEKSKLQLIGEIAEANNKKLELIEKINKLEEEKEELNRMCEIYSNSLYNADLKKAEKRIKRAIEYIELCIIDYEEEDEEIEDFSILKNILKGEE